MEANGGQFLYETPGEHIIMENGKAVGVQGRLKSGKKATLTAVLELLPEPSLPRTPKFRSRMPPASSTILMPSPVGMLLPRDTTLDNYMCQPENWKSGTELWVPVVSKGKEQLQSAIDEGWAYTADTFRYTPAYFQPPKYRCPRPP